MKTAIAVLSFILSVPALANQQQDFKSQVSAIFKFYANRLNARGFGLPDLVVNPDVTLTKDTWTQCKESEVVNGLREHCQVFFEGPFETDMKRLSALLMASHEAGHMIGGGPLFAEDGIAVEGEADYQSGPLLREFIRKATPNLGSEPVDLELEKQIAAVFKTTKPNVEPLTIRIAAAGYLALKTLAPTAPIDIAGLDKSVAPKTLEFYPSQQARWDTIVAGLLGKERPRSWALPSDFSK